MMKKPTAADRIEELEREVDRLSIQLSESGNTKPFAELRAEVNKRRALAKPEREDDMNEIMEALRHLRVACEENLVERPDLHFKSEADAAQFLTRASLGMALRASQHGQPPQLNGFMVTWK
jgi:hypothetical protein